MTLVDFLLARIAEDEEVAEAAGPTSPMQSRLLTAIGGTWHGHALDPRGTVEYQPARVLAECAAKRAIIDLHHDAQDSNWPGDPDPLPSYCAVCHDCNRHEQAAWPCTTLRLLAAPYRDHPDFDPAWETS